MDDGGLEVVERLKMRVVSHTVSAAGAVRGRRGGAAAVASHFDDCLVVVVLEN